jgi:hypothetical protein
MQQRIREMSPRWTRGLLERCAPREIVVLVAAYGAQQVADRLGVDIQKLIEGTTNVS